MSSSDHRNPYSNISRELKNLTRTGIRDSPTTTTAGGNDEYFDRSDDYLNESIDRSSGNDDEIIGEDESLDDRSNRDGNRRRGSGVRTRSRSREQRRSPEKPSPKYSSDSRSDYEFRRRIAAESNRTVDDETSPPRQQRRSPPRIQRATYADDSSTIPLWLIALLIVLALSAIGAIVKYRTVNDDDRSLPRVKSMNQFFQEQFRDLQKSPTFSKQRPRLWTTIRSTLRNLFDRYDRLFGIGGDQHAESIDRKSLGERSPAVLLFVMDFDDEKSQLTTECLVKKLTDTIENTFIHAKSIDPHQEFQPSKSLFQATESSKSMDERLRSHLSNPKLTPIIVVRNVELISPSIGSILHAYCDNENAPHKEAVYLLTAECQFERFVANGSIEVGPIDRRSGSIADRDSSSDDGSIDGSKSHHHHLTKDESDRSRQQIDDDRSIPIPIGEINEKDWDRLAERCLRRKWIENSMDSSSSHFDEDKMAPILSRIANNVVFVRAESIVEC